MTQPHPVNAMTRHHLARIFALAAVLAGASAEPVRAAPVARPSIVTRFQVVDEQGRPVAQARIELGNRRYATNGEGYTARVRLPGPAVAVARAPGHLVEPVVIGHGDDRNVLKVRLWSNPGGTRYAVHSSGDVMFGRRYNAPTAGRPLIPDRRNPRRVERTAVGIVEPIRPVFGAADFRTLNLETVISRLPDNAKYPGKRFILNSWPESLAAVRALGADLVLQANNHVRDYLDLGARLTIEALDRAGLRHQGAVGGDEPADEPARFQVAGQRVGVLAWTTVNGNFVNDNYPLDSKQVPADLADTERWQYEFRVWGFQGPTWKVPAAPHRMGTAWTLFDAVEAKLPAAEAAAAWQSMVEVYPELQDWVARRGHGGASQWTNAASPARIAATRPSVDLLIVQLHAGFQFQPVASDSVRTVARRAIDAGADIVICHHPHVLQGAEWYRGRLIVYSLGNFVFDQDFLSTFASGILRTVWDGRKLLEARLIPVDILDYVPSAITDRAAERVLLGVWESSVAGAEARRGDDGLVRVYAADPGADTVPAQLRAEGYAGRIDSEAPVAQRVTVAIPAGGIAALPGPGLIDRRLGLVVPDASLWVGRELFGWGRFEDENADGVRRLAPHWALAGTRKRARFGGGAERGQAFLRLERYSSNTATVMARPAARVTLPRHRLYAANSNPPRPLDGEPSYSVRLWARLHGSGQPGLRLDLYAFDDTNPTEDPNSQLISQEIGPLNVPRDGRWHEIVYDIPASSLETPQGRANMVLAYASLGVPKSGVSQLDIDDLEVVEWREAARMPAGFGAYGLVRNLGSEARAVTPAFLPLRD